jgi:rhamnopyranosyl-N-acetylglucosaminyl-diphospho-decaprenol beta-1,3/1,4-galactofuranosyltransferase
MDSENPGFYGHGSDMPVSVVAVVVTYNRRDLLAEALAALSAQTRLPDHVIVVDNASTDGTAHAVRERFPAVELVELSRNTGGAGGFATGLARALDLCADLAWLMDDDTIPTPTALGELLAARARVAEHPALLASRVVWTDGRDHPMNTPRTRPGASRAELTGGAAANCVPIRSASFVSVLVDMAAVRERGLPIADYFLWNDDFEFTTRLLRGRTGLLCRDSVVVHKTKTFAAADTDPGPRFFYEVRNKIWLFTRSPCLAPAERLLYAGATLRRWARTFIKSPDRVALTCALARGLRAGLLTKPRPTEARGRGRRAKVAP